MRIPPNLLVRCCSAALLVLGCGGSQPAAQAPPGDPAAAEQATATPTPSPDMPWKEMSKEQRASYMMKTVMPRMKDAFVAYNAEHYAKMNCATCHGDGAKDKTFEMPNPQLPKLPATPEGFKAVSEKHPDVVKFMGTVVVPEMAKLLGEEPYNPETGKGFGCFGCHEKQ